MWLWRSAVGFVERHKKAVMLGAVAGVGTVFALRKMKGAAEDMMEGMQKQALEEMQQFERTQRIEGHLTRTRSECQRNIQNFMPMIHKRLLDQLGLDAARKEAARKGATRDEKLVAWEEIKVLTLTRLFAGAYALAAQSMVLRVQLHISQRHQYERICVRGDAAGGTPGAGDGAGGERQGQAAAEIAHGFLMVSVEHLLGSGKAAAAAGAAAAGAAAAAPTGLEQLVELVRAAVEQETKRCTACRARFAACLPRAARHSPHCRCRRWLLLGAQLTHALCTALPRATLAPDRARFPFPPLSSWTIAGKLQVKAEDLRALFDAIRARLGAASVQQCLLWPEGGGASSELQQLLDEARDMLER